ncbi:MAG TPA: type II secretion system F family protein [Nitriliruptorales bacterium]
MIRRVALALAASLVALMVGAGQATAQDSELQIKIREAALDEDGGVRLIVQPVGEGAQAVTAADVVVEESGTVIGDITVSPLQEERTRSVVVALVIDVSGSMQGEPLTVTKAAASGFVERVAGAGVRVILVTFADQARVVARSANTSSAIIDAIQGLEAGGETALYDAVVLAADELGRLVDAQRNLVVFSDGGDTASQAELESAVAAAHAVDVPVSAVTLVTGESDLAALNRLTGATGGSTYQSADVAALDGAFTSVATELTNQYVVRYRSARADVDELDIQVRWSSAGGAVTDTVTVVNPRRPPAPEIQTYTRPAPGLLGSRAGLFVGIAGVFVAAVMVLSLLLARPGGHASKLLERDLSAYIVGDRPTKGRSSAVAQVLRQRARQFLQAAPRPRGMDERLQHRLDQAAWPLRSTEFYAIMTGAGAVLALPMLIVGRWWLTPAAFAVGAAVPWLALNVQRSRRRAAFLSRFPDTLQLLAGSLRAGYGIVQAVDSVGREAGPPTSEEFARVLTEARLGAPLEDALDGLADRMDSEDVRWVVLAIKIQREVGGNLAELLTTVAKTLREREALRRQIKVLSAEGKLSAIVLIVLPFLLAGYLTLANPTYVRVLVENQVGWILIVGGITLMGVGVLWIRKMIRIEV